MTFDKKVYMKEYGKEYNQRPEVIIRKKEYTMEYRKKNKDKISKQRKEYRKNNKEKIKEYYKRPEVKERRKEYNQRPNVKVKRKEQSKKYNQRPNVKIKKREYSQRLEIKEKKKEYYQNNKNRIKEWDLKRHYGLNIKGYNKLLKQQGGVCAICRNKEISKQNKKIKFLSVDHDHITGKNRGLLCKNCNTAIGSLSDDVLILQKAIEYLKKHKKKKN